MGSGVTMAHSWLPVVSVSLRIVPPASSLKDMSFLSLIVAVAEPFPAFSASGSTTFTL